MFESKIHPLIIPQHEHGRMAGMLAAIWGNRDFDWPVIPPASFVKGVTFHDRGYGTFDDLPIGGIDEADWLAVTEKGIGQRFDDPCADIVALLHLKRLLSSHQSKDRQRLIDQAEVRITGRLPETGFALAAFTWADRITNLCDMIAFDFAFGSPNQATRSVYPRLKSEDEIEISYTLDEKGTIVVQPWPFSLSEYQGFIVGYQREGYPERLEPEILNWRLVPDPAK